MHENIAAYDLAGGLARQEPELADQILFGVRALLLCERRFAGHLLDAFERGESSLLETGRASRSGLSGASAQRLARRVRPGP